jgi:hypothetical protein
VPPKVGRPLYCVFAIPMTEVRVESISFAIALRAVGSFARLAALTTGACTRCNCITIPCNAVSAVLS